MNQQKYLWLSHELRKDTPAYGGGTGLAITTEKCIASGASCNSVSLSLPNHLGTHVDVPFHFIESGKKLADYAIHEWIFNRALLLEINVKPDDIVIPELLNDKITNTDIDILLIKTGFEQYRGQTEYWQHSPAFSDELADYLKEKIPTLAAIGFDTISLTGYQHRELGRKAHRAFLSRGFRIFEDMHLKNLTSQHKLKQIIAMPLRFENSDGSPCTMVASYE